MFPSEEQLDKLRREFFAEFDACFFNFAKSKGFDVRRHDGESDQGLGRFPRYYLQKTVASLEKTVAFQEKTVASFDLFVDAGLDNQIDGKYVSRVNDRCTVSMGAGAGFDVGKKRYAKIFLCFKFLPIDDFRQRLPEELEKVWAEISNWDADYVKETSGWTDRPPY